MRSRLEHEHENRRETDSFAEFNLLSEVWRTPEVTQRSLASRLSISLGLTNLLLRNVVCKGYVRVARANWRRRLYALTPKGMMRRVFLTSAYVGRFLDHYHKVKLILREELEPLSLHAESRVAIYGAGEIAELVYLGLRELGIDELDIFASENPDGRKFLGMPLLDIATLQPEQYDRVLVVSLGDIEADCEKLRAVGVASAQLVPFFDPLPQETADEDTMDSDTHQEGRE